MFDSDERSYLNSLSRDSINADLSRKRVFDMLSFAAEAVDAEDLLSVELVNGLLSKIAVMLDSDWEMVKVALPFDVPYDTVEDVSPVDSAGLVLPMDEDGDFI